MKTVWLSDNFTSIGPIFRGLKESMERHGDRFGRFRIALSSKRADFPGREFADEFFLEPEGLGESEHAQWALGEMNRLGAAYLIPGHKRAWLSSLPERTGFPAEGLVLSAGSREIVEGLEDKDWTFREMGVRGLGDLAAPWASARDAARLREAIRSVRESGARRVCVKPARGVYGSGFRFLSPLAAPGLPKRPQSEWPRRLTEEQALEASLGWGEHEPIVAMPMLRGPELSVDAFARGGKLVACFTRAKRGRTQRAEDREDAKQAARRFAEAFHLNGFFNLQARFDPKDGALKILEINPRLAGGVAYGQAAGFDLVYWSLAWMEGSASQEDFPEPLFGEALSVKPGRLPMRIAPEKGLAEKLEAERKGE